MESHTEGQETEATPSGEPTARSGGASIDPITSLPMKEFPRKLSGPSPQSVEMPPKPTIKKSSTQTSTKSSTKTSTQKQTSTPPTPMTNPPRLCWICWNGAADSSDDKMMNNDDWGPAIDRVVSWMLESPSNKLDIEALGGGTLSTNTWKSSISMFGGETYEQRAIRSFATFRAAVIKHSGGRIDISRFRLSFGSVNSGSNDRTFLRMRPW